MEPMTRLIAGDAGGLALRTPDSRTRPTTERTREAMFSRLAARLDLEGMHVLDLYAGSAALGLEAVSRGADVLVAVEHARRAAAVARANAAAVTAACRGRAVRCTVVEQPVTTWLASPPADDFDLVLVDPPYAVPGERLTDELRMLLPHLAPRADVVVERSVRSPDLVWPAEYAPGERRRYGETVLWFAEGPDSDARPGTETAADAGRACGEDHPHDAEPPR